MGISTLMPYEERQSLGPSTGRTYRQCHNNHTMTILIRVLTVAVALLVASRIIPGIVVDGFYTAVIVAVLLGLINLIVRPVLVVLTLPITILTLGLSLFVLNALLFWFVGSFVEGFYVAGFIPAFWGSLVVSLVSWFMQKIS
jgi:putative membrane protein